MNNRAVIHYVGHVLQIEALLMLPSLLISLYGREWGAVRGFLLAAAVTLAAGFALVLLGKGTRKLRKKDGFVLIALSWIAMSLMGALPYRFSGEMTSLVDCLFESISGFTTTAASVAVNVEALPRGLLFWRSMTLWIGGMGVLVFLMAIAFLGWREVTGQPMEIENPGPIKVKLVPRLRDNARILYGIYLGLTLLETFFLALGGMPLLESLMTSMATVGTGGFSVRNLSIQAYGSLYIENVILIFMLLSGINFHVFYFLLVRKFRGALKDEELRVYLAVVGVATLLVTADLVGKIYPTLLESLRHGLFQVVSIVTTTGFSTANFGQWPELSKMVLFVLMFMGACAGSSGGGLKVSRVLILFREARQSVLRMSRPRTVTVVKLDGKRVDKRVIDAAHAYLATYCGVFLLSFLLISLDNLDFESSITAVAACMNNVGAALGIMTEAGYYELFSPLGKIVLSVDMLLGRLEIYPILLLLSPRTWRRM